MVKNPLKNFYIRIVNREPPESNQLLLVTLHTPPKISSKFVDNFFVILLGKKQVRNILGGLKTRQLFVAAFRKHL